MTENRPEVARPLAGIALMVLAMQLVAVTDAAAKILSADYPVLQISWARCFFQFIFLLPIFLVRHKPRIAAVKIQPRAILRHSIRGGLFAAAMSSFFVAIRDNPIPDSLAVLFISPLFVTAAAPFLLRESFDWRRGAAVVLGFLGVLAVLRPGGDFRPTILFALMAGICYGGYIMATRESARRLPPLLTAFYAMTAAAILMTPFAILNWTPPDLRGWLIMSLMGLLGAFGHYFIAKSCEFASASLIAPFNYSELICAVLLSYFIFNHFPDGWTWGGILLIVGSGVYVSIREYRRRPLVRAPLAGDI